jgi:MFS family permease
VTALTKTSKTPIGDSSVTPAIPVMAVVFLSFIIIGMALPVLPLHVHDVLGFGPLIVGVVAGGQFAAALISRLWAGRLSDSRGARLRHSSLSTSR